MNYSWFYTWFQKISFRHLLKFGRFVICISVLICVAQLKTDIDCINGNLNRVLVLTDNPGQCALASYLHRIRFKVKYFLGQNVLVIFQNNAPFFPQQVKFWSDMKCQVLIEDKYSFVKGQISKFRLNIAKGTTDPRVEFTSQAITQILIKQFQND